MTSLIALYRRRGTTFLVMVGLLLLGVVGLLRSGALSGFPDSIPDTSDPLMGRLFSPLAQLVAGLFWVTLSLIVGLVWGRALFGVTTFAETYLVGALLGTAGFPILYTLAVSVFKVLASASVLPEMVWTGEPQVYALLSLFMLLLSGILLLISREVIRALSKPVM